MNTKELSIENLRALVHGHELNTYQKALALNEFKLLESKLTQPKQTVSEDYVISLSEKHIQDAYDKFVSKHGYDLRDTDNPDHLAYFYHMIEGEELLITYREVTPHDCPYSVTISVPVNDKLQAQTNEGELIEWISIEDDTPNCFEAGEWDGFRSGALVVKTKEGELYAAVCYEGVLDGSPFLDFYEFSNGLEIKEVTHWILLRYLPF